MKSFLGGKHENLEVRKGWRTFGQSPDQADPGEINRKITFSLTIWIGLS